MTSIFGQAGHQALQRKEEQAAVSKQLWNYVF